MARITIDDCLERIPNRFELTLAATNRARQITAGATPMVDADRDKPTVIALREIAAGKIGIEMLNKTPPTLPTLPSVTARHRRPSMSEIAEFTRHLGHYLPASRTSRCVERAFDFSESAHRGQFRKSGEPYITHPLAVASILPQWHLDAQALTAALLHDVMEDTVGHQDRDLETTSASRSPTWSTASPSSTRSSSQSREEAQAENFRKMLLAMARDVRVILIKLADRLHNMRTLDAVAPAQAQAHRARDARDLRADRQPAGPEHALPRAQDLSFKHLYPMRYRVLAKAIKAARGNRREVMNRMLDVDPAELAKRRRRRAGAAGARRRSTRVYKKMREKHLSFSQVLDIYGFRVLVADDGQLLPGARRAARACTSRSPASSRTTSRSRRPTATSRCTRRCSGRSARRSKSQIRTHDMHRVAEAGVAAHWLYKDGGALDSAEAAARDAPVAAEPARDPVASRATRRSSSSTSRSTSSPTRSTCSRRRARSWRCRAAPPRSTSRTACTPTSATTASRRGSTTSCCRCAPSSRTATTSRS